MATCDIEDCLRDGFEIVIDDGTEDAANRATERLRLELFIRENDLRYGTLR